MAIHWTGIFDQVCVAAAASEKRNNVKPVAVMLNAREPQREVIPAPDAIFVITAGAALKAVENVTTTVNDVWFVKLIFCVPERLCSRLVSLVP